LKTGCGLFLWLLVCAVACAESPRQIPAPLYTPSSIVNAANPAAPALAPNTIATIYGSDLAFSTRGLTTEEIRNGMLPTVLIGTGVRVAVNGIQAAIYFVSPNQINFLVPDIRPGNSEIRVSRDSLYGPAARVAIADASPALFQMDPEFTIATRADGSLITRDNPARPGEIIILYATGLGATRPRFLNGEVPSRAAAIERFDAFRVILSGITVPSADILYAGVAPGFPGLYQVNLRVPEQPNQNPEVRIALGESISPPGILLYATGQ
jgi:uncharacterized protein (TIGR03437 family)